jgi:hypothetical protein
MPSITITDGYTFSNWGPLTTTFTAPVSCATATGNYMIGANSRFLAFYSRRNAPQMDSLAVYLLARPRYNRLSTETLLQCIIQSIFHQGCIAHLDGLLRVSLLVMPTTPSARRAVEL